jgi:uncharacterized damage-inducible protein DinB
MALVDHLLPEFDHEMATTRKLLERVPEDRLSWKPHAKSFSLGQLAQHVANIPTWGTFTLERPGLDLAATPPAAELGSRGRDSGVLRGQRRQRPQAARGQDRRELMAPWSLKRGDHVVFTCRRPPSGEPS